VAICLTNLQKKSVIGHGEHNRFGRWGGRGGGG